MPVAPSVRPLRRLAGGVAACALAIVAAPLPAPAQTQLPRPSQLPPAGGQGPAMQGPAMKAQPPAGAPPTQAAAPAQQGQAPAPPKPYKPVAVQPPKPFNDASFEAFRKQLATVAEHKDRAGLGKLVVANGFYWEGETGDKANKKKSGLDNLASAIALDDKDGTGWYILASAAAEPTAEPVEDHKGVICSPGSPTIDDKAFEELAKSTGTNAEEWGYPTADGIEVRSAPQSSAPVIEKLGINLVRVLPDETPPSDSSQPPSTVRVVAPSGKVGYVPFEALAPITFDQMCYVKDAAGWKITGYVGGD